MAEVKGATCSNCGKSGQLHQCIGCIESQVINGDIVPASYCSKACQSAHWKQHKKVCVVRKRLRRAGDLLKTVWLAFREEAFDICLTQVGWEGSKLHTYEGEYAATDVLVRFPHHLVSSPVDREMVLSHRACSDAPADTFNVSKKVLESICSDIIEVTVEVHPGSSLVVFHNGLGDLGETEYKHELLVVRLNDGVQYALDLAGAQYGQLRTVLPWTEYRNSVSAAVKTNVHGFHQDKRNWYRVPTTVGQLIPRVQAQVRECLDMSVEEWEQEQGFGLERILRASSEQEYQQWMMQLITKLKQDMGDYIEWAESHGKWGLELAKLVGEDRLLAAKEFGTEDAGLLEDMEHVALD